MWWAPEFRRVPRVPKGRLPCLLTDRKHYFLAEAACGYVIDQEPKLLGFAFRSFIARIAGAIRKRLPIPAAAAHL
ncbi:MAG: hypothetical protein BZY87_09420 [SAR202 cluster bacterium Io17-Chloro-G6]|nr:MAG: hypothetical protein BZY87_09420 [SAR202 cluster bacterium Io17-Chloro-G6]